VTKSLRLITDQAEEKVRRTFSSGTREVAGAATPLRGGSELAKQMMVVRHDAVKRFFAQCK
jgi:hypothetical protein